MIRPHRPPRLRTPLILPPAQGVPASVRCHLAKTFVACLLAPGRGDKQGRGLLCRSALLFQGNRLAVRKDGGPE
jgi:hypothetical protein